MRTSPPSLRCRSLWSAAAAACVAWSAWAATAQHAQAQTMYRCGNVYQDRACDAGQAGKVVNTSGAGSAAPAQPGANLTCLQRAEAAQRIVWVRETGQTEEMQVAKADATGEDTALIRSVYRRSGTAMQIRSAIEAECLAETGGRAPTQSAAATTGAGSSTPPAEAPAQAPRRAACSDLATTLDTLRQTQRIGGSATVVESMNRQIREAQQRMRDAGC